MLVPDLDWVTKSVALVGGIIGAIGGLLGIWTSIRNRQKEVAERIERENENSFLASFMMEQVRVGDHAGPIAVHIEIGSDEWKRAEKLVERGILIREPLSKARRELTGEKSKKVMGYRLRGLYEDKKKPVAWA